MGIGIKVFFVEEGDKLRRITLKRYEAIYFKPENAEPFPEYAGQKIRCALVIFNNENCKPLIIRQIDYSLVSFDENGRMRRDEWEKLSRLAVESIWGKIYNNSEKSPGNLVNANHIFAQKQMEHEFKWKPSPEIEKSIIDAVFIKKKIIRKPHLRLVKPPQK